MKVTDVEKTWSMTGRGNEDTVISAPVQVCSTCTLLFLSLVCLGTVPTGYRLSDINISFHHLHRFVLFSAHREDGVYKMKAAGAFALHAAKEAFLHANLIKENPLKILLNPPHSSVLSLSLLQWFERQISGFARLAISASRAASGPVVIGLHWSGPSQSGKSCCC